MALTSVNPTVAAAPFKVWKRRSRLSAVTRSSRSPHSARRAACSATSV